MCEFEDVQEFLRQTKQEAIEKERVAARRGRQRKLRGVNKSMAEAEDVIFRSLRFAVNNIGPRGSSAGRRRF